MCPIITLLERLDYYEFFFYDQHRQSSSVNWNPLQVMLSETEIEFDERRRNVQLISFAN